MRRAVKPGERVALSRHVITLNDGHRVGVSVAGEGVPFVFFHGISLPRRIYDRCLSRLPQLGFLVVSIDAPGHGDTGVVAPGLDFAGRIAVLDRAMRELGISRAVISGHSMGGRTTAALAALDPERCIAAVLVDAAMGPDWDLDARARIATPIGLMRGLADAVIDTRNDARAMPRGQRLTMWRALGTAGRNPIRNPAGFRGLSRAIARPDSEAWLDAMRLAGVPTVVVHGKRDLIVAFDAAEQVSDRLGAPLVVLPDAHHSWLIADPDSFCAVMSNLVENEVGAAIDAAADRLGLPRDASRDELEAAMCEPRSLIQQLVQPTRVLGVDRPPPPGRFRAVRAG